LHHSAPPGKLLRASVPPADDEFRIDGRIKKRRSFTASSMHLITGNSPDAGAVQIAHEVGGDSVRM
jgi:hypothetical protein